MHTLYRHYDSDGTLLYVGPDLVASYYANEGRSVAR